MPAVADRPATANRWADLQAAVKAAGPNLGAAYRLQRPRNQLTAGAAIDAVHRRVVAN